MSPLNISFLTYFDKILKFILFSRAFCQIIFIYLANSNIFFLKFYKIRFLLLMFNLDHDNFRDNYFIMKQYKRGEDFSFIFSLFIAMNFKVHFFEKIILWEKPIKTEYSFLIPWYTLFIMLYFYVFYLNNMFHWTQIPSVVILHYDGSGNRRKEFICV